MNHIHATLKNTAKLNEYCMGFGLGGLCLILGGGFAGFKLGCGAFWLGRCVMCGRGAGRFKLTWKKLMKKDS